MSVVKKGDQGVQPRSKTEGTGLSPVLQCVWTANYVGGRYLEEDGSTFKPFSKAERGPDSGSP